NWSVTDYGILSCSAINVPIYPTQAVDQVAFILRNSGARVLFVGSNKLLKRIQPALDSLKKQERPQLILFESAKENASSVTTLEALEKTGAEARADQPQLFEQLAAKATPEDVATIIYTSVTTGEPKRVILTHRNLVSNALQSGKVFDV